VSQRRVRTGVQGLDEMMNGGFLPGSVVLVRGAPGTGKTTLGLQFLMQGHEEGEAGLLISFEQFPRSLYRDAASLGWNLEEQERQKHLHLMFTSPEVFLAGLETPGSPLDRVIQEGGHSPAGAGQHQPLQPPHRRPGRTAPHLHQGSQWPAP
jgi:circadian clock protein KaiC